MSSVNKVILVGRLTKDPEIKSFPNGGKIANFTLATSEAWRDKTSGEKKERSEFHNIVIRNEGLIGIVERYIKKGSKLYIEGSLQTRKWQDASGNDRFTTEIVLAGTNGTLTMLDGNSKVADGQNEGAAYEGSQNTKNGSSGAYFDDDGDVPFN